jgi:hypothetical protein
VVGALIVPTPMVAAAAIARIAFFIARSRTVITVPD